MMAVMACGLLATACGGRVEGSSPLEGTAAPTAPTSCDVNPYGVCYPTANIGTQVLTLDAKGNIVSRGNRAPNFRFTGFRATSANGIVDTSRAQVVSLADFYDPDQTLGITVIHLLASTMWCGPSNDEADLIAGADYMGTNPPPAASWAKELAPLGVVFLEVLIEGPVGGAAATLGDLQKWVSYHDVDYSVGLDPEGQMLGMFDPAAEVPFNMDIDARSMEMLDASDGIDTALDGTIKTWIAWEQANPPLQ